MELSSNSRRDTVKKFLGGLFARAILCLAIDILEYVFDTQEGREQTAANKQY